jgi:electron transport complex protein RnfG
VRSGKMKNFVRMSFTLFVVCVVAGSLLAVVNRATKDRIAENAIRETESALKEVFPSATDFREEVKDKLWDAYNDGEKIGAVLKTSTQGYGGIIEIMLGVDNQNRVSEVKIVKHSETPGLGSKIVLDSFLDQFKEKTAEEIFLKRDNQSGTIDAITAATISSRAVTNQIRKALQSYIESYIKEQH